MPPWSIKRLRSRFELNRCSKDFPSNRASLKPITVTRHYRKGNYCETIIRIPDKCHWHACCEGRGDMDGSGHESDSIYSTEPGSMSPMAHMEVWPGGHSRIRESEESHKASSENVYDIRIGLGTSGEGLARRWNKSPSGSSGHEIRPPQEHHQVLKETEFTDSVYFEQDRSDYSGEEQLLPPPLVPQYGQISVGGAFASKPTHTAAPITTIPQPRWQRINDEPGEPGMQVVPPPVKLVPRHTLKRKHVDNDEESPPKRPLKRFSFIGGNWI